MAETNTKKYLSLERLCEYDALLKADYESKIAAAAAGKADTSHNHDDAYYTKTEIDGKIGKIDTSIANIVNGTTIVAKATNAVRDGDGNVIANTYATKDDAQAKLEAANKYTDDEIAKIENGLYKAKFATNADHATDADNATWATNATNATNAVNATKASEDIEGNVIHATYETKEAANEKLAQAKTYADTKTANMATTTVVDNKINAHNTSTEAHSDIRDLVSTLTTKVNNFLDVDDATTDQLSEVLTLIENNKGTLDSLTSNKVNVSDIVDNLTTTTANKVLSANQGVALKTLIDALQEAVDDKAADDHTHTITANAEDDDVIVLVGTNGTDSVSYTASHANSGVTAGTYTSVTVNQYGHVTAGTNPTTLEGYGITDAAAKEHTHIAENIVYNETSNVGEMLGAHTFSIGMNNQTLGLHSGRLDTLEAKIGDGFTEITSEEISALFSAT